MQQAFDRVLDLQLQYTSVNTEAMEERGLLIRNGLRTSLEALVESAGLSVEGRDATGRKSRVPWVRIFDRELSPKARFGFYLVYLFHEDGSGFTLSLIHATTEFVDGSFRPFSDDVLAERVDWARDQLRDHPSLDVGMVYDIDVGVRKLAKAYGQGHVVGFTYGRAPEDARIIGDLTKMVALLQFLYGRLATHQLPGGGDPVITSLTAAASAAAGRKGGVGAPRRQSAAERMAIERHAMDLARYELEARGWKVKDTSLTASVDFEARRKGVVLYVEVKGTTTDGVAVILTPNEVALHRERHPNTCLVVVRNIVMYFDDDTPMCAGGEVVWHHPWQPVEADLTPVAYTYTVPTEPGTVP